MICICYVLLYVLHAYFYTNWKLQNSKLTVNRRIDIVFCLFAYLKAFHKNLHRIYSTQNVFHYLSGNL